MNAYHLLQRQLDTRSQPEKNVWHKSAPVKCSTTQNLALIGPSQSRPKSSVQEPALVIVNALATTNIMRGSGLPLIKPCCGNQEAPSAPRTQKLHESITLVGANPLMVTNPVHRPDLSIREPRCCSLKESHATESAMGECPATKWCNWHWSLNANLPRTL